MIILGLLLSYLAACIHSAGHLFAARLLAPRRSGSGRRGEIKACLSLLQESVRGRHTLPISHAFDPTALYGAPRRLAAVVLAGELASLCYAAALAGFAFAAPRFALAAQLTIGATAFFFVFEVLPVKRFGMISDITLLRSLRSRDTDGRRTAALAAIDRSVKVGRRPREWHPAMVQDALAPSDGSRADAEAALCAYYFALDMGDTEGAEAYLQRATAQRHRLDGETVIVLRLEAAYLAGSVHRDAERAGAELRAAREEALGSGGRHWGGINRSRKAVTLRAATAVLLAAGEHEKAAMTARRALLTPDQSLMRKGPTAGSAGACERDWLRALHDAAVAEAGKLASNEAASAAEMSPAVLPVPVWSGGQTWQWRPRKEREPHPPRWPWVLTIVALMITLPSIGQLLRWTNTNAVDALELPVHTLQLAHRLSWVAVGLVCAAMIVALLLTQMRRPGLLTLVPLVLCTGVWLTGALLGRQDLSYAGGYRGFLSSSGGWLSQVGAGSTCAALLGLFLCVRWQHGVGRRDGTAPKPSGARLNPTRLAMFGGWLFAIGFIAVGFLIIGAVPEQASAPAVTSKSPTLSLGADPAGGSISFSYDAGLPEDVKEQIWQSAREAQAYFVATFGRGVQRPVLIDVRQRHPDDAEYGGYAAGHRIVLYTQGSDGTPDSGYFLRTGVIHELFHVLQEEWSDGADVRRGPKWLLEGSAEYVSQLVMVDDGTMELADLQACLRRQSGVGTARLPALRSLEPVTAIPAYRSDLYALSALGVDQLVAQPGAKALGAFYAELARTDWPTAFHDAFGADPAAFYATFEQARAGMARPSRGVCDFQYDED